MPFVLDESSYRIDDNTFYSRDDARVRAANAADKLGRPVTVYELVAQELHFAFRVMPDGTVDETDPLPEHVAEDPVSPAVLGYRHDLDLIAEVLEQSGRPDLAAEIDRENEAMATEGPEVGIRNIAEQLKRDPDLNV